MIKDHPLQMPSTKKIPLSNDVKDLMSKLLNKNPKNRLGAKTGVKEIMAHPWFKETKWKKVMQKKVFIKIDFKLIFQD